MFSRRQQLSEHIAEHSRCRLKCLELKSVTRLIEKQLHKKYRLNRFSETSLLKSDFKYWVPPCIPFYGDEWRLLNYDSIQCWHRKWWNASNFNKTNKMFDKHVTSRNELGSMLSIWWPDSHSLRLSYEPDNEGSHQLEFFQDPTTISAVEQTKAVAKAFEIDQYLLESKKRLVFDTKQIKLLKSAPQINVTEKSSPGKYFAPWIFGLSKLTDVQASISKAKTAIHLLQPSMGDPVCVTFTIDALQESHMRKVVEHCKSLKIKWVMYFFSEYKKGFDPFARPKNLKEERLYPVVSFSEQREVGCERKITFLELQITVHHAPTESSLLLHTQHDYSFLEEVVKESGLDVEMIREEDSYEL